VLLLDIVELKVEVGAALQVAWGSELLDLNTRVVHTPRKQ